MRDGPERPRDLLTGDRRARRLARARRRGQIAALYWVLGAGGLAAVALLLIVAPLHLLGNVATADQAFHPIPRMDALALIRELGGYNSQAGDTRSTVLPTATPLPRDSRAVDTRPAAASAQPAAPDPWRIMSGPGGEAPSVGARKLPATGESGAAMAQVAPGASVTPQLWATPAPNANADGLPPARTPTASPMPLAMVPAFGSQAAIPSRTLVPPTPVPSRTLVPPTAVASATLVSPTAVPTLPKSTPSAIATRVPTASPTSGPAVAIARRQDSSAAGAPPAAPVAALVATPSSALPTSYKLGDVVQITDVLKGFASTAHWVGSEEGIYATDWYPKSATERCANSHRMPLAMPVAGKWRLSSMPGPMGGTIYSLIGELEDGNSVGFTHVDSDVTTGWAAANTVVGFVGISGLERFDALGLNPSHAHTAWNDRVVPGWNGDKGTRPAKDFFSRYGFQVELRDPSRAPSPLSYMARQACGGV